MYIYASEQKTPFGNELAVDATPRVFSYQYNMSGLIAETYPSGRVVRNEFDADGDLMRVSGNAAGQTEKTYANSFNYNSAGAITSLRLGNGKWETAKYNNRLQVTEIGLGSSATDKSLLKLNFDYGTATENNGSMKTQTMVVPNVGANQGFTATQTYNYDSLNRIQSATETVLGSQTWKQTFTYDRYGNRRFDAANTTTLGSCSQVVCNPDISTATNRLVGYGFDKTGNVTVDANGNQFLYDAENHQKEIKNSANQPIGTYLYDGEGKRVKKISNTETVIFVYDGGGQLAAEYSTQSVQTPQTSYLTADHLGSPRIITNQLGAVTSRKDFAAFGDETITAQRTQGLGYKPDEIRQDYTGYQKDDESGLEYAQARYYNSAHGRFTSVDPLTASATIKDPQTFNRYSYALNSPYKFSDPLGLLPEGRRSGDGSCGAEHSSCSDNWGGWEYTEAPEATPTDEGVADNQQTASASDSQQQAVEPEPPPPSQDSVSRTQYPVTGSTAKEAIADAEKNNPNSNGTPGQTDVSYSVGYDTPYTQNVNKKGVTTNIRATNVEVATTITVSTPQWQGYEKASPKEKAKWDTYVNSLNSHEDGHVKIGKEGAAVIKKAVEGAKARGSGADKETSLKAAESNLKIETDRRVEAGSKEVQKIHDKFN